MSMEKIKNEMAPLMMKCAMVGHEWRTYHPKGHGQRFRSCRCCGARQRSSFVVIAPKIPHVIPMYREEWIDD